MSPLEGRVLPAAVQRLARDEQDPTLTVSKPVEGFACRHDSWRWTSFRALSVLTPVVSSCFAKSQQHSEAHGLSSYRKSSDSRTAEINKCTLYRCPPGRE